MIVAINIFVSLIISSIIVSNHQSKYIHLESPYLNNGAVVISRPIILTARQYVQHKDDLNSKPDYYKYEERYIDYEFPVRIHVMDVVRTKDGDLINRTDRCYDDGKKVDC